MTHAARLGVTLALLAGLASAGVPGAVRPQELNCRWRTVLVNVVDRDGFPVQGFSAEHFRASYRGRPVRILSLEAESRPRRIVVLLDASGSMQGASGKWDLACRAAGDLISLAPAENSVALITFGDKIYDKIGFAQNPQEALNKVRALQSPQKSKARIGGQTALFDAILEAVRMLSPPQRGDAIYVITDGGETSSKSDERTVQDALVRAGIRLFGFVFVNSGRPTGQVARNQTGASPCRSDPLHRRGRPVCLFRGASPGHGEVRLE